MVGREGELRPKMIRKMITIRLGDNKEGLIFDTTPVIVHMVETTRSNKALNAELDNPMTDSICAELSRHANTWTDISNCDICNALNSFDTKNGYASNTYYDVLGLYTSKNKRSYIHNDVKWLKIQPNGNALAVTTRQEFYDTNGNLCQFQIDDPAIKKAFENKTAI